MTHFVSVLMLVAYIATADAPLLDTPAGKEPRRVVIDYDAARMPIGWLSRNRNRSVQQ